MKEFENLYCVFEGQEAFMLVSPIFRDNIMVGHFENWPPNESPFSFFGERKNKFPLAKTARFIEATLEAGDCMYVPAYFYVETKTKSKQGKGISIIMNHQYESHSRIVDMIMTGIQDKGITGDKEK